MTEIEEIRKTLENILRTGDFESKETLEYWIDEIMFIISKQPKDRQDIISKLNTELLKKEKECEQQKEDISSYEFNLQVTEEENTKLEKESKEQKERIKEYENRMLNLANKCNEVDEDKEYTLDTAIIREFLKR